MFIVELEVGTSDNTFAFGHSVESAEKLAEGSLHKSSVIPHHGVGLSRSSLSIDEDTTVVTFESVK